MNLVIGKGQLAQYFPEDYTKISSRNVDFDFFSNDFEAVYLTFAEQRIYDLNIDYITPNYLYTLKIIESLLERSKKIVCYTSCELWNQLSGKINLDTPPHFQPLTNEYCLSKLLLWNKIKERRKIDKRYEKVIFIHPFYFNSVHRNPYFLFGKIFNSIIKGEKIEVGNLDFYRDMVHTSFIVKKSIEVNQDMVIGAGKLFNVRGFIKNLYQLNGMNFNEMVKEDTSMPGNSKLIMADVSWEYSFQDLLWETQNDILKNGKR